MNLEEVFLIVDTSIKYPLILHSEAIFSHSLDALHYAKSCGFKNFAIKPIYVNLMLPKK